LRILDVRAQIRADLLAARADHIEAKALRARLGQLHPLSRIAIAIRHSVPLVLVLSIAKALRWTGEEKPPKGPLPPYDPRRSD
jgi:hypothetical protein